jgi:mannose-6-phosphate isomerase-like protein (cupin superfamily)
LTAVRHTVVTPGLSRKDERGLFTEIVAGFPAKALLSGRMKAGSVMGNHYHERTRVFFYVQDGSVEVRTVDVTTGGRDRFTLESGQGVVLEPGVSHAIRFTAESSWLMLKSEAHDPNNPDTVAHAVP